MDLIIEEAPRVPHHGATRRDFLLASVNDGQAFVRAIDTKAYVALVTQGLIVAGIVNLARMVPDVWDDAGAVLHALFAIELLLLICCFLGSVMHLLVTVSPTSIRRLNLPDASHQQIFHLDEPLQFDAFSARVAALDTEAIEEQLTAVAYAVAAIHRRKTRFVRRGYRLLMLEVIAAAAFMTTLGATALI